MVRVVRGEVLDVAVDLRRSRDRDRLASPRGEFPLLSAKDAQGKSLVEAELFDKNILSNYAEWGGG